MIKKFVMAFAAVLCTAAVIPLCASADRIFNEDFAYDTGYDLGSLECLQTTLNGGTMDMAIVEDAEASDGKAVRLNFDNAKNCLLAIDFPDAWKVADGNMTMEVRMKIDPETVAWFQTLGQLYGEGPNGEEMKSWGLYAWTNDQNFMFLEKGGAAPLKAVPKADYQGKYFTIRYTTNIDTSVFTAGVLKGDGTPAHLAHSLAIGRAPSIIKQLRFYGGGKAGIYIDYVKFTQEKFPQIISSSVNDGDINLPEQPEINLYFDTPLKAESVNKENIKIKDNKSGTVIPEDMYDVSYTQTDDGRYEVKVNVISDLVNGETYTLAVSGAAADSETERIMKETKEISFTVIKYFNIDNIEITDNDGILTVNVDYSATVSDAAEKPYYIIASLLCEENGKFRIYKSAFDAGIFSAGNNSKAMTAQFEKPAAEKCFVNIMLWDSMNNSKSYIKSVQKEFGLR